MMDRGPSTEPPRSFMPYQCRRQRTRRILRDDTNSWLGMNDWGNPPISAAG